MYWFTGKAGHRVDVRMTGGDGVWMFLLWKNLQPAEHPALFYMEREWQGRLQTTGKYTLTVVTDKKTASYKVQIKVD